MRPKTSTCIRGHAKPPGKPCRVCSKQWRERRNADPVKYEAFKKQRAEAEKGRYPGKKKMVAHAKAVAAKVLAKVEDALRAERIEKGKSIMSICKNCHERPSAPRNWMCGTCLAEFRGKDHLNDDRIAEAHRKHQAERKTHTPAIGYTVKRGQLQA